MERRRLQLADPEDEVDAKGRLADALLQYGEYGESEPLYRSCLAAQKETLGDKHPSTLGSLICLAILLKNIVKRDEAEQLYRSRLAARKETLGDKHPMASSSRIIVMALRHHVSSEVAAEEHLVDIPRS